MFAELTTSPKRRRPVAFDCIRNVAECHHCRKLLNRIAFSSVIDIDVGESSHDMPFNRFGECFLGGFEGSGQDVIIIAPADLLQPLSQWHGFPKGSPTCLGYPVEVTSGLRVLAPLDPASL